MASIRWGIFTALGAFILSLCLGMIAQNQALRVILTAFVFGIFFFGVGFGLRIIINNFFPELLYSDNQAESDVSFEDEQSNVNMTMENSSEYAVPEMYKIPGKNPELGNIEDLISGNFVSRKEGIDDRPQQVYNNTSDTSFLEPEEISSGSEEMAPKPMPVFNPGFTPSFGDDEGLGGLPDLDAMAMAFSTAAGDGPRMPEASSSGTEDFFYNSSTVEPISLKQDFDEPDRSQYKGNKPQSLDGDFDPKEIAQGIRTVLNKDK